MKHRISITIDEETLLELFDKLRDSRKDGSFRNKSHLIDFAIKKFLREGK